MGFDCLTLVTDYGTGDGFVGVLHAVAFRIAPAATVIDVDHSIPPQDVRLGALRLERTMRYLPVGVHVGVVDPGVGGTRRAVALSVDGGERLLVGPDNGLLVWAAEAAGGIEAAVVLDQESYWLHPRSATFDGRDVFVPVAAHLCAGVPLRDVGSQIDPAGLVALARPRVASLDGGGAEFDVVQLDRFGNVQLAGESSAPETAGWRLGERLSVVVGEDLAGAHVAHEAVYVRSFGDVPLGDLAALIDSDGAPALSVNSGSAAEMLGISSGGSKPRVVIRPLT